MKTRKRRAALKRTAMSGFCRKKDGAGPECRFEAPSFGMREDISSLQHTLRFKLLVISPFV